MPSWISKKLLFAMFVVAAATVLAAMSKIDADQWLELVKYVGLGYLGVQGGVDITKRIVNGREPAPPVGAAARKKTAGKK